MFNHQNRHKGVAGHHTTSLGRKHVTFLAIMCGIMLIAVYGVMSVINLSAHANTTQPWQKLSTQFAEATSSLIELTSPLTIKYKTVDTPMLSWQYAYNDIYELVADSKGNDAGSLGVYEADVDSATFTLIDEIALPENGVTFDAKKYLTSQDDLIVVTLRQSAFELASMIYQDDRALQECTISFCVFALTENGNAGVLIEDSSMFPALYCGGAPDNNPSFTFIDGPVLGMQMMKTVNNTAFIPESMEPRSLIPMGRSLTDISDMSADELINSTIDAIGSVNVETYANSSDQTYMFSNLVSGAVFEITYSDGTKVRTTPTSSYGLTSISLDHYIDIKAPENPIKFPIEFTIQEITAPSGCVLDDTVYSVSISKERVVTVSPDNDVVNFSTGINHGMFFFNDTGKEKAVTVEKVAKLNDANDNGIADEGETIDYTFFITNDGSDLIGDMRLEDPMLGLTGDDAITVKKDLTDDIFKPRPESVEPYDAVRYFPNMIGPDSVSQMQEALNEYMLFPGETVRIKSPVSYTVTDDDVEAGIVTNEAMFVGQTVLRFTGDENVMEVLNEETTAEGDADTPTKTSQPGTQPSSSMTIVKEADKDAMSDVKPGDTITYSFTITNTGNTTLSDIDVVDNMIEKDGAEIDTSSVDSLAAGESATLTADYAVTDDDIAAGIVTNVATATATDDSGSKVETVESKAVTTIERTSEAVADEKPAENENAPAEETPTDEPTDDGSSSDIVDIVQTGVANHSTQTIVAIVTSAIIVAVIAYRKIMK